MPLPYVERRGACCRPLTPSHKFLRQTVTGQPVRVPGRGLGLGWKMLRLPVIRNFNLCAVSAGINAGPPIYSYPKYFKS
jgi:hypothetical protein